MPVRISACGSGLAKGPAASGPTMGAVPPSTMPEVTMKANTAVSMMLRPSSFLIRFCLAMITYRPMQNSATKAT
jgi:hypothetical protein